METKIKSITETYERLDGKQGYGMYKPYNPDDMSTLAAALDKLGQSLADAALAHGKAHDLKWVVKDWRNGVDEAMKELPEGCTATVGWKADFEV